MASSTESARGRHKFSARADSLDMGKKRSAAQPAGHDAGTCVICLTDIESGQGTFVAPCGHSFHVQCAEQNYVLGRRRTCPCCRAVFNHAPGFVALAHAEAARLVGAAPGYAMAVVEEPVPDALPDVPPPSAPLGAHVLAEDFARVSVVTDVRAFPRCQTKVSVLATVHYKDDDDDTPVQIPSDFVILADVSGSMQGAKLDVVRDALLKMSEGMFGPLDRVALVAFNHAATQLTPMAPIADPAHEAAFRGAAMSLSATGGTNFSGAMELAARILDSRSVRNPGSAQVLLLSDGMDVEAGRRHEDDPFPACDSAPVWTTMGFGRDHDAAKLSSISEKGRGSFTYIDRADMLDETLASYVGDATRVLASDVKMELRFSGHATVQKVKCPGAVEASGAVWTLSLGPAQVDGRREILIEMTVTPPAEGRETFDALSIVLRAEGVSTGVLAVGFSPTLAAQPVDEAAIAAAFNREQVAIAAAAAVQAMRDETGMDAVRSIFAAARTTLKGGGEVRALSEAELGELELKAVENAEEMTKIAAETAQSARRQHSLMAEKSWGGRGASKGSTMTRYRMVVGKRVR